MKKLFLMCVVGFVIKCNAQNKEVLFDKTCNQIVTCLAKGKLQNLNKYIQANTGICFIYRIGAMDAIRYVKHMSDEPFPQYSQAIRINENKNKVDDILLISIKIT